MGTLIVDGDIGLDLEKMLLDTLSIVANEKNITLDTALELVSDRIPDLLVTISEIYKSGLEKNKVDYINYNRELMDGFESRLYETWKEPLERFELLIVICREIGAEINVKYRRKDCEEENYKLEVLTRLHAHTIHIACEIMQLLKGGYADGAMARWRSMHESAVISRVIATSPSEIAKKYYLHKHIDDYKFSRSYSEYSEELGFESLDDEQRKAIFEKYDSLIKEYGKNYASDNGWAIDIIEKNRITFFDLESLSGLSFLRPYYKFASVRVHLGSKSLDYKLSLSLSEQYEKDEILLSGPSNEGLLDPMQCTAMSLIDVTISLMSQMDDINYIVFENILNLWNDDLKDELTHAFNQLSNKQ